MKCIDCPYFWADRHEDHASCKFKSYGAFDPPPCEQEDVDTLEAPPEEYDPYDDSDFDE